MKEQSPKKHWIIKLDGVFLAAARGLSWLWKKAFKSSNEVLIQFTYFLAFCGYYCGYMGHPEKISGKILLVFALFCASCICSKTIRPDSEERKGMDGVIQRYTDDIVLAVCSLIPVLIGLGFLVFRISIYAYAFFKVDIFSRPKLLSILLDTVPITIACGALFVYGMATYICRINNDDDGKKFRQKTKKPALRSLKHIFVEK